MRKKPTVVLFLLAGIFFGVGCVLPPLTFDEGQFCRGKCTKIGGICPSIGFVWSADCAEGLFCSSDDQCRKKECETSADCKVGWKVCNASACTPKSCTADQDCGTDGVACLGGFCAPKPPDPECLAGQTRQCYNGPPGTQRVGICQTGTQDCENGSWGKCQGEIMPTDEICDGKDNDCNGQIDEIDQCQKGECSDGAERPCGSAAVGICKPGKQICSGKRWGACQGGVNPDPKETCNNKLDDNCNGQIDEGCTTQSETWALALGGESPRVAVVGDNIVVAATTISGSIKGKSDILVVKLDKMRKEIFRVQFGGDGDEVVTGVAMSSSGDIFVTGYYAGQAQFGDQNLTATGINDGFLLKLDAGGKVLSAISFGGGANDVPRAITIDNQGNVYLAGQFNGPAVFGTKTLSPQDYDVFVAKLSPDGQFVWAVSAGGSGADDANAIAVDGVGNVYVTGTYRGRAKFGSVQLSTQVGDDVFVTKLDTTGQFLWAKGSVSSKGAFGQGIAVDSSGNVFVAGSFQEQVDFDGKKVVSKGGFDLFLAKYGKSGVIDFVQAYGSSSDEKAQGLALSDGSSQLALTGHFTASTTFGGQALKGVGLEAFVAIVDLKGVVMKTFSGGGSGADEGVRAAWSGQFLVTVGSFNFEGIFGGDKLVSQAPIETFVWRFQP